MWFLYVVAASLFTAVYYFGNQSVKVSPNVFMLYRGFMPVVLLLPFLPQMNFIAAWQFYVCCVAQGLVIAFIDNRNYQAMQKWGAEIVSAVHPLAVGAVFVLWFVLHPTDLAMLWQQPGQFCGIVLALCGVIYATSSLKKVPQIKQTLWFLLPFFFGVALCDNFNKLCMSYLDKTELLDGSYFYILITGFVVGVINLVIYMKNKAPLKTIIHGRQNLLCAAIMLLGIGSMLFKNLAMFHVSNPSYVTAALYLYVIWIMAAVHIFPKLQAGAQYAHISRFKILLLLISAVALVLIEK